MQNRTISMWDLNKFKHDKVKYETKFQRDWERERELPVMELWV